MKFNLCIKIFMITCYNVYGRWFKLKIILKRVAAYLIDIIIVTFVSTLLTSNSYINKDYEKYVDTYDEYSNYYDDYQESLENLNDKKDELEESEFDKELDDLNKEYLTTSNDYSYKLSKLSFVPNLINILFILLYFVVFQFYFGGITLGKKLMKIKVVSNNDKKLTIFNFFIRSLILNSVFLNVLSMVYLMVLSKNTYIVCDQIIYIINYILELSIIITCMFRKDHRGLHDLISNTKVVEVKEDKNEV